MKRFFLLVLFIIFVFLQLIIIVIIVKKIQSPSRNTITVLPSDPNAIVVDYATQTGTGSPLVFGGAHAPNLEHQDAWNMIKEAGVTMIRRDLFMEYEVPKNITLADYKNNIHDVQNPDNWNRTTNYTNITITNQIFENAKIRGIKVLAILAYVPKWLSYSGNERGIPKDWEVFEDIVKKSYKLHRPYVDMIEIWNEPDIKSFLDLTGSSLSRKEAYELIFKHAVQAIKTVDAEIGDGRKIPILAPAAAHPENTEILDYLLSKSTAKYLDGVSIHSYNKDEPSWSAYLEVMKKYGKEKLSIFVTEWNKTSDYIKNNEYINAEVAIPYTAQKLIQFLKYGIAGANYFSTTYYDPDSPVDFYSYFGFYSRSNNKNELLPQGKTWQLLSRSLGLGAGTSRIYSIKQPGLYEAIGFTNSKQEKGMAIVNDTDFSFSVPVLLKNLKIPRGTSAHLFIASGSQDAKAPFCTQYPSSSSPDKTFLVSLLPQSVVGIIFVPDKISLDSFLTDIGISTNNSCLIGL